MGGLVRAWNRHRRENRFLFGAFLFLMSLTTGAFYLLQRAQSVSPDELTNRLLLFILWYLDISLILILSFVIVRNVVRLVAEWRSGILGGRFRTKLVLTYVALTFVPVIFIFLIATNLLQSSIDRWFSSPVEEILLVGSEVTIEIRKAVEDRLLEQVAVASGELRSDPDSQSLARLRTLLSVDLVAIYDGPDLVQAVTDPRRLPAALPPLNLDDLPAFRRPRHSLAERPSGAGLASHGRRLLHRRGRHHAPPSVAPTPRPRQRSSRRVPGDEARPGHGDLDDHPRLPRHHAPPPLRHRLDRALPLTPLHRTAARGGGRHPPRRRRR